MPEPGPFGETFFEARLRAISGALFVNRSFGGWVESVVTLRTQRLFGADFGEDFAEVVFRAADLLPPEAGFLRGTEDFFAVLRRGRVAIVVSFSAA